MEQWKPVFGFENLYEVSNFGGVRRIARGKLLTPDKINEAKQMFYKKAKIKEVAAFLGVSVTTVMCIKQGKTWSGDASYRICKTPLLKGYAQITMCKNGKYYRKAVHRVVWEAFVGPIDGRLEINHKDLDRNNNNIENLEVVTHQQNLQHAIEKYKEQGLFRAVKGVKGFVSGKHSKYIND